MQKTPAYFIGGVMDGRKALIPADWRNYRASVIPENAEYTDRRLHT